jgi:hypothetical protein
VLLKTKSAPEDKVLLKMMTSSEATLSEADNHQKLKIQELTFQKLSIGIKRNAEDWECNTTVIFVKI